jgi:outer membrane protein insertion porin family
MTASEYVTEFCRGNRFGCPTALSPQVQQFFVRGEAQQNSLLRVNDSAFGSLRDYKASLGVELRVQVPVVNVPFRLIYYYNPNAKIGFTDELPGIFLPGKRSGFKFSVGRTF